MQPAKPAGPDLTMVSAQDSGRGQAWALVLVPGQVRGRALAREAKLAWAQALLVVQEPARALISPQVKGWGQVSDLDWGPAMVPVQELGRGQVVAPDQELATVAGLVLATVAEQEQVISLAKAQGQAQVSAPGQVPARELGQVVDQAQV